MVFVHGCFWHQHDCLLGRKKPFVNIGYWHPKLARNVERDRENLEKFQLMGWQALVIWECETSGGADLTERIASFLGPQRWHG